MYWSTMDPEPLALPDREHWLRALPGGPLATPRRAADRVRVVKVPGAGTPAEVPK